MRVRLFGNHSKLHCGCAAVWRSMHVLAVAKGWRVAGRGEDYDALIVNGEGSMHHSGKKFHEKMTLLRNAIEAGKDAYLINSVWQENSNEYDDVLRRLAGISVREIHSRDDLSARHGIVPRVNIDLAFFAPLDRSLWYRRYFGADVATDFWVANANDWGACDDVAGGMPRVTLSKRTWGNLVASLRTAGLLVTGRQHAVYAASRARLPFAAAESNTHKIGGLIATSGVDIPFARTVDELPEVVQRVRRERHRFLEFFRWIEAQSAATAMPAPGERWA